MKESTKKEEYSFDANIVMDTILTKIQAKYIESTNNKKQEWFSISFPIEHTIKGKNIDYKLIIDDKIYNDVNFKELYDLIEKYSLFYYIDEEKINFSMNRNDIPLLHKYKDELKENRTSFATHIKSKRKD